MYRLFVCFTLTKTSIKGSKTLPFPDKILSMKFNEYINTHHVFTTEDLFEKADSQSAAKQQLKEAAAKGTVERVRRGLYVSNVFRFNDVRLDPCQIVLQLDPEAVLSYHSALEVHGVAHNIGFECRFRTTVARSEFSYRGIRYIPHSFGGDIARQRARGKSFGEVYVTTREQTVFDCLKHPEWAGGVEEAIRALSMLPYIDSYSVAKLAMLDSASMASRVGWLLEAKSEDWRAPTDVIDALHEASAGVVSRLDKNSRITRGWSKKWCMRLPEAEDEVASWVM